MYSSAVETPAGILTDTIPRVAPMARQAAAVPEMNEMVRMLTWPAFLLPIVNGVSAIHEWPQGFTPWIRPRIRPEFTAAQKSSFIYFLLISEDRSGYFDSQDIR
jgi:hypothetical protein